MISNWAGDQITTIQGSSWILAGLVIGIAAGGILSAFQWLALRRVVRQAWVWVPANALAWVVGLWFAFALSRSGSVQEGAIALVVKTAAIGLGASVVISLITAVALMWLLRGEKKQA